MPTEPLDASSTIDAFLSATAAKRPSPGGGAVTALAGALATAIGEMVLSYSIGKKDLVAHDAKFKQSAAELRRARQVLLELMLEDQGAFDALNAARKACNNAGDKDPAFAAALLACIRIPQAVGATAAAVLDLCCELTPIVNRFLLSDLAVCAELSMCTVRCAAYNVLINLGDLSDPSDRKRLEESTAAQMAGATVRVRQTLPAIWRRLDESL